ncbi:hypothetical protein JHK84_048293 [Glycine max]|nr:hypothetical protein JHK84_048293 [Glycine max]
MEIPRKYLLSPILSLILLSFIIVVVLRPCQLLEFAPIIAGSKPAYSVPLDSLRTKLSSENQLHAVGNSGELRRNKFRNRTATRKVGKLEQRLAAARAAMRKVASESEGERSNLSVATTARDDSYHRYVPAGAIYRNARLFYR